MRSVSLPEVFPDTFRDAYPEYHKVILQLLYNRKLTTDEAIEHFLNPEYHHVHDPFLFRDMAKAVARIYRAIDDQEVVAIHGDYDADGVCGSVILQSVLDVLGAKSFVFLPHRDKDGYGLNEKTVDYLHEQKAKVIITCDCGISNRKEIAKANSLGIDTIITDHHQIPQELPDAFAIIHPKIVDETYPFKFLAGGGVAFKLAQGLLKSDACTLEQREREIHEKWLLDLVAIASVADMVELIGENRTLVTYGLFVLAKTRRLGLKKLLENIRMRGPVLTAQTISFQIAPRINAAGRMDHANTAYMLLRASKPAEAEELALLLETQNSERQVATERMYREAMAEYRKNQNTAFCIVYNRAWTSGFTGLLAGKVTKEIGKPTFILGFDGERIVGSGRAPDNYNIMDVVKSVQGLLLSFGGHPQACGFRFEQKNYDAVVNALQAYGSANPVSNTDSLSARAEAVMGFSELTWDFVDQLFKFEPFGQANPEPVLVTEHVRVYDLKRVGKKMNHLKLVLEQGAVRRKAIAFYALEPEIAVGKTGTMCYTVGVNEWNGNRDIQLMIKDFIWE